MSSNELWIEQDTDHAVLLFHAYTSYSRDFTVFSRALEEAGYSVYAPHLSGHGLEDPDGVISYTIKDWMKDGQEALDLLKEKGYEKISAFGLSLGGIVATYLALENPDLHSAGTFSSPMTVSHKISIEANFKEWYYNKKEAMGHSKEEIDGFFDKYAEADLTKTLKGIEEFKENEMVDRYEEIDLPFFIGQGAKDNMIDPEHAKRFRDMLTQADVTFKWYEEGGHVITIGRVGKDLREDVVAFLQTANEN